MASENQKPAAPDQPRGTGLRPPVQDVQEPEPAIPEPRDLKAQGIIHPSPAAHQQHAERLAARDARRAQIAAAAKNNPGALLAALDRVMDDDLALRLVAAWPEEEPRSEHEAPRLEDKRDEHKSDEP